MSLVGHQLRSSRELSSCWSPAQFSPAPGILIPPSQWVERFSGVVSQVCVQHLALPGCILVVFLNYTFWTRSPGVGHKLLMS